MKPISLEDLRPEPSEFYLKSTDKTYNVRPINLADEAWLIRTFGEGLRDAHKSVEGLCQIIFRQLTDEDKKLFHPVEVESTDQDGNSVKEKVGGWRRLMAMVSGMPEKVGMTRALLQAQGVSSPLVDDIVRAEIKKKEIQESQSKPIGESYSTSSPQSTDGASSESGASHEEKST